MRLCLAYRPSSLACHGISSILTRDLLLHSICWYPARSMPCQFECVASYGYCWTQLQAGMERSKTPAIALRPC